MRIGELAERAKVSPRALRYYEEHDLLTSERTSGGQRTYPAEAVARVRLIQQLYAAGLSSSVIVRLLPCVHTGIATAEQLALLSTERDRIARQVEELGQARDRLDDVIAAAGLSAAGTACG